MGRMLDVAHRVVAGALVVVSFGGLALWSERFWDLIQHTKRAMKAQADSGVAAGQTQGAPVPPRAAPAPLR